MCAGRRGEKSEYESGGDDGAQEDHAATAVSLVEHGGDFPPPSVPVQGDPGSRDAASSIKL